MSKKPATLNEDGSSFTVKVGPSLEDATVTF